MANQDTPSTPQNIRLTNISVIDEGHNKLSEIQKDINSFRNKGACMDDLAKVFFSLSHFFENFLIREELYLKSKGYPNFDGHKASHFEFIKGIERLKDNYGSDVNDALNELVIFIDEWLQNHTSNYTSDVVNYLIRNQ